MMVSEVILTSDSAEAWDDIVCHVGKVSLNLPEMAWLSYVLPLLPDSEQLFPRGKWASIQELKRQLEECAKSRAESVRVELSERGIYDVN
jgi:hypothetical protein